jgi:superfamily II DNA helicase RecQ
MFVFQPGLDSLRTRNQLKDQIASLVAIDPSTSSSAPASSSSWNSSQTLTEFEKSDDDKLWDEFSDIPTEGIVEDTGPVRITPPTPAQCTEVLNRVFNIDTFRAGQLDIITEALSGRDMFVLLPTGGGKSLCFQLPAVLQNEQSGGSSVTVVISPLLALVLSQIKT